MADCVSPYTPISSTPSPSNPRDDDDNEPDPSDGEPEGSYDPGDYVTEYNGGGSGLYITGIQGIFGLDGECADFSDPKGCTAVTMAGGNVPLNYAAWYDVLLYENLLVVTIHEKYVIPKTAPPLMQAATFGRSTLLSRSGLDQTERSLGNFLPGNIARSDGARRRDTHIYYWGKENFPDQLLIRVEFGADGLGSQRFYYPLPYVHP